MAFKIDDMETGHLIRLLAERRRVTPEAAVRIAVRNQLDDDEAAARSSSRPGEPSSPPMPSS
jgi:hypothetical protein